MPKNNTLLLQRLRLSGILNGFRIFSLALRRLLSSPDRAANSRAIISHHGVSGMSSPSTAPEGVRGSGVAQ